MKNRWFTLFLVLFFAQSAFSQESLQSSSFQFGVSLNPKIAFQITDEAGNEGNSSNFGLSLYGDAYFEINPRVTLKNGLGIHNYYLEQIDYSPQFGCDNVNGSADPFNSYFKTESSTFYLGIPLELQFLFSETPSHFYFKLGAEGLIGVLSNTETKLYECGNPSELVFLEDRGFISKQVLLFAKIGIGYEFQLTENNSIFIEPVFEYSLFKTYEDADAALVNNSRLVNVGLLAGMKF